MSLVPPSDTPLYAAINAKVGDIVQALPAKPAWYAPWMRLSPQTSPKERLAVYQAIRDSGCLPAEAGFFLVSWQIDAMASDEAEYRLRHLDELMEAVKKKHGLDEDDFWLPEEAPQEYERLRLEYQDAWDELFAQQLEFYGEAEMARLLRADPEAFDRQSESGRAYFHGPLKVTASVPAWLQALVEAVCGHLSADTAMGPMGFRCLEEDGFWMVLLYPTPVELLGGAHDGAVVAPGFTLDLEGLREEFDEVIAFSWQALGFPDGPGPHVSIEGMRQGHKVFVEILAHPPDDEEPGMRLDASGRGV